MKTNKIKPIKKLMIFTIITVMIVSLFAVPAFASYDPNTGEYVVDDFKPLTEVNGYLATEHPEYTIPDQYNGWYMYDINVFDLAFNLFQNMATDDNTRHTLYEATDYNIPLRYYNGAGVSGVYNFVLAKKVEVYFSSMYGESPRISLYIQTQNGETEVQASLIQGFGSNATMNPLFQTPSQDVYATTLMQDVLQEYMQDRFTITYIGNSMPTPNPLPTVSGVWEFNSNLESVEVTQAVYFTSGGNTYTGMTLGVVSFDDFSALNLEYDHQPVFSGSWMVDWARVVDFGDTPQEVSQEYYNMLLANAVQQTPTDPEEPTDPTPPADGEEQGIFAVWSKITQWIVQGLASVSNAFYANGKLTLLGTLCIIPIALGLAFLLIAIIQKFLRLRG